MKYSHFSYLEGIAKQMPCVLPNDELDCLFCVPEVFVLRHHFGASFQQLPVANRPFTEVWQHLEHVRFVILGASGMRTPRDQHPKITRGILVHLYALSSAAKTSVDVLERPLPRSKRS